MDSEADRMMKLPNRHVSVRSAQSAHGREPNLKLSGRFVAKDVSEGGGVPLLISTLHHGHAGHDCLTVRGCPVTGSVHQKRNKDQRVVHPADRPLPAISGVAGLRGNLDTPPFIPPPLAGEGRVGVPDAIVKVAAMADLKFAEPARFDGEEACFRAVKNKKYREGEVLVIRYERPQRGRGMREALAIRAAVALLFGSPDERSDIRDSRCTARPPAFRSAHAGYSHPLSQCRDVS